MKFKHIIPSFLAALAFVVVGCSEDDEKTYLDGLRVSQSYVSISENGGKATITIDANADWAFKNINEVTVTVKDAAGNVLKNAKGKDSTRVEKQAAPEWLTVTPTSGAAGQTEITFSAESTLDGRTANLEIVCGGNSQLINVVQGESKISDATCAEVMEGPESKTYRVKGIVTRIANTEYGNWYLDDGSYSGFASTSGNKDGLYIYGTLDKSGKAGKNNSIADWGIEVGDEITVEGPKSVYNGTVELVNVTVVKIEKSLIKVDSLSVKDGHLPVAGGDITAFVTCKGNGISVEIPEDAREWLTMTSVTANSVTFHVAANTGGSRKTTLTFKTNDGTKDYSAETTISQDAFTLPHGEAENDPFTVEEVLAYVQSLGTKESENNVYVKGVISSIKYTYSAQFGTATYNISDDGNEENVFTVYSSYYLNNQPWVEGNDQIEVGDKVLVCGKVINYNGTTPEFASKKSYLVSLQKASAPDPGTLENPFTPTQALETAGKLNGDEKEVSEQDYYIKGKISQIKYEFSANFGTAQFHISADGTTEGDQFLIYGTYYLGNRAWSEGDTQIAVGDDVIICGKITNYNGTLETANKKNYIYSLNGATE